MKNIATMGTLDGNVEDEKRAVEMFQAREEEIEKKKVQVREKLEFQLDRVEEKTRRLARLWEELEALKDPMKKELATVRKKVDRANHELKSLGKTCHKKVPQS
ncbi:putative RAB6-interacting golgin [Helianthus annuus]|nr:putative RAB6-interacting golgin [Helianthus annuus]KAJ0721697.1 putative RAB6-interacting golgin [Helianthus annuus]